jgi:hypothetical protein
MAPRGYGHVGAKRRVLKNLKFYIMVNFPSRLPGVCGKGVNNNNPSSITEIQ